MRLQTFGALAITSDDGAAADVRVQRRQLALLAVLATGTGAGIARERLLALFWPDSDSERARHALDQTLYVLRRALGADQAVEGSTTLRLNASVLPSDVSEFTAAVERGDPAAAVSVYAGPFLDAISLPDAAEFERWVDGRRGYYAHAFVVALTRLATAATAAGDPAGAVGHLRRAAATDPLSGTVAKALMLALAAAGDRSAAIDAGRVHATLVENELEAVADTGVRDLMEQLRAGSLRTTPDKSARSPASPRAPSPAAPTAPGPTAVWDARPTEPIPRRIADALAERYEILGELGSGGMATVYLARDVKHDRQVALKVLRPDLAAMLGAERFLNEIRITARLDHPHILTLIDSGAIDGVLFYVLPYVRGHSLRQELTQEKQLSLDASARVTSQVASALDYAHEHGVIHRDIKPENILLQEGEAMLTDFGIALAVREAGGDRLTQTGTSLGTPQYMSPEQAMGDRTLDARSDVYSLGAVVYEMLAGEPPHTGATAQVIIAKLMNEQPIRLRSLRPTVPPSVDDAVAKALAKVPSDRYESAGALASAVAAGARQLLPGARPRPSRTITAALALAVLSVIALWSANAMRARSTTPSVVLRDRTQLTFTDRVSMPAVSSSGRQLAYVTKDCAASSCRYAIDLQNVGQTVTKRVASGATSIEYLEWSPDGRSLMAAAVYPGEFGFYLISTLDGSSRLLKNEFVTFFAGGDSLLLVPIPSPDSTYWLKIADLDGVARDSIPVTGAREGLDEAHVVPGSSWIIVSVRHGRDLELRVIDRRGRVADRWMSRGVGGFRASRDALWTEFGEGANAVLVRTPIDTVTGRRATRIDTVHTGASGGFSVTPDGRTLVLGDGTVDYDLWALGYHDALKGKFAPDRRLLRASSLIRTAISPDGARLLVAREIGPPTAATMRLSVIPFKGGEERPLPVRGKPIYLGFFASAWADSVTVDIAVQEGGHVHFFLEDVRTETRREEFTLPDSSVQAFAALPGGGWAWIPTDGQSVRVQRRGEREPRAYEKPSWYIGLYGLNVATDGRRLLYSGAGGPDTDSTRLTVLSLPEGAAVPWATVAANITAFWLNDGSISLGVYGTADTRTFYRLREPGKMVLDGTIPRPLEIARVSRDLERVAIIANEYHGDAWMWRVARP